jgi:hypothetical protein
MAYNIKITCEPNLSAEDILRLVLVTDGTDQALKIVKV